ncbi:MAG: 2-amino-3-ketobutyrate coenzyme A ligase [Gammaproteobacteria bacterium]|nr:2-amino-3-ketobutyrate coenzyme A ligase [Gammaproteobacteria bacterium]
MQNAGKTLESIREQGLYKQEQVMLSPQSSTVRIAERGDELNLCANNYLGLADCPELIEAAKRALDTHGLGMASVRFICGTQDLHKELERRVSEFLGTDDAILFSSCFDANAGVFEALLGPEDAVISDALNHASIIDGIRLCKAKRFRYANNDMGELETRLQEARNARYRLVVTDGVFSMDGIAADLASICELAERYDALVMVDDSHATGVLGERGSGTPSHCGVAGRVQLTSSTFGKALGGASGGFVAGPGPLVELLRQRARPYLFSNSVAPPIVAATLKALDLVEKDDALRHRLHANARYFRRRLAGAGFELVPGEHPIIPIMIGDARRARRFVDALMQEGIYVTAFSYPVVPEGRARVRTQMSASHTEEQLKRAANAFARAGRDSGIVP